MSDETLDLWDMRAHNDYAPNHEYLDRKDCSHCQSKDGMVLTHAWEQSLEANKMKLGWQCLYCKGRIFTILPMPDEQPKPSVSHPVIKFTCPRCSTKVYGLYKIRPEDDIKRAVCYSCLANAKRT